MNPRTIKSVLAGLVVAGSLGAASARAADSGFYVGGSIGAGRYQDSVNGVSGNGDGASGKVYGGYQINPYVGVEGGYADLGHVDNGTGRVDGRAEYFDVVGSLPLGANFALLGSVGLAHVNLDTSAGDGSGNGPKFGLGAQYSLSDHFALRAQAERYRADAFGEKPDVDQYTVGVRYTF